MIELRRRTVALGLAAAAFTPARLARAATTTLTVILTNDIYQMGDTLMPDGKRRGGFARLAAVVNAERAKGGHVLFAHGGDTLSPSSMSGIDQGAHIVALTNALGPDIFVPGNHEFDFGKTIFLKRMAEAKFPVFAANLVAADDQPLPGIKDRDFIGVDDLRIGLTGAAHERTPQMSNSEDLKFLPAVATLKAQAEALRRDGADLVIVVAHADRRRAFDLAATHSADVILTGHSHDLFVDFDGRRLMVESAHDAQYVTVIDLHIELKRQDNHREIEWWPQFRIVDTATVTPDPDMAALVASFQQELDRQMSMPIATTSVTLDSRNAIVRSREAAVGNLVADAMRGRTRADAAIMNGGGIRAGAVYQPGASITRRDVLAELPFGNHLVTVDIKGRALWKDLENGLSRLPAAAGRFPQVSGLKIEFDPQRPPGNRVLSIELGGAPLDPDRTYRVATNDFIARGGDDYSGLAAANPLVPLKDTPLLADEVMIYLRDLGHIEARVEGRITAK
jgi:2',3'-cyclic-nucleotide 2'-phosphodiesterase (5'-nucleotidase family)